MKKLLFVNGHLNSGGVEKSLVEVLRHLDYSKYEVDLLLLEENGDYIDDIPKEVNVILKSLKGTYGSAIKCLLSSLIHGDFFSFKMRLVMISAKFFGQKRYQRAHKLVVPNKQYDIAIAYRTGVSSQIVAYAINAHRKITWWHHGEINVDIGEYIEQVNNFDKVVCVSKACVNMLTNAMPSISDKLVCIPNMIDSDELCAKAKAFNPNYPDTLNIVSVGRLCAEKHYDDAIYAAKKLKENNIDFVWHIVGDGELRTSLEKMIAECGVDDCVVFEGNQPNPYPYIKNADIFVHPSYVESLGIVVLEALALGIPCVVTKSAGVCEFLIDGTNALLCDQDRDALAMGILSVINDINLYKQLKQSAILPSKFTTESVVSEIDTLLQND